VLKLAAVLKGFGVSYADAAATTGLSKSTIAQIILQNMPISVRSRRRIEEYLATLDGGRVPPDWDEPEQKRKGVAMLGQEVLVHFGFSRHPFVNEILDPDKECFLTEEARWVERNIEEAINRRGFCALVGDTGSGKTTLVDRLLLRKKNLAVARPRDCDSKFLKAAQIYDSIVFDFEDENPRRTREDRARQMEGALIAKKHAGEHPLLLIEESHHLHVSTLRAVKAFYELKLKGRRLLAILLVGQKKLKTKLDRADMLEVGRRCQVFQLNGFESYTKPADKKKAVRRYLELKLGSAGVKIDQVFTDDAIAALATRCVLPLHLNVLAGAAMTEAWAGSAKRVTKEIVNEC